MLALRGERRRCVSTVLLEGLPTVAYVSSHERLAHEADEVLTWTDCDHVPHD